MQIESSSVSKSIADCEKGNVMRLDSCCKTDAGLSMETTDACTCSHCLRTFKSGADLVRSGNGVLCIGCYERLIDPYPRLCCDGAAF
jgi:hypothetical protein